MTQNKVINNLSKERFISLCTFKRNGDRIETPVIFGVNNGDIILSTKTFAIKLKRIKNIPYVVFYP